MTRVPATGEPARVLFVHNAYRHRGGAERMVETEAALLAGAGAETAVHEVDSAAIVAGPAPARWARYLQAPYSLTERRRLARRLRAESWDLVHFHNLTPFLSASVLDALPPGMPRVMTLDNFKAFCVNHVFLRDGKPCELCPNGRPLAGIRYRCHQGSLATSAALTLAQWTTRRVVRLPARVDRFLCPSAFLRDRYARYGYPADRLEVLPNFAEDPGGAAGDPAGPGIYAGRFAEEKGVGVLVAALAAGTRRPFVFAGAGPLAPAVADLAAAGRAEAPGWLAPADVRARVARARYLVMPSICYENQPVAVLEALAAGVPVVGTSGGALGELVTDGVNGFLVPPGDPAALAAALDRMAGLPVEAWRRFSAAARERYLAAHTPAAHLAALRRVYGAVVEARVRAG